jgi:hypothetical protein
VKGVATTNAKRKPVDAQLMLDSEVSKYCAAESDTAAKVIQSQEMTMLRRLSWASPRKRRL